MARTMYVRDKKTRRIRRKNPKRMMLGIKSGRKRKGKKLRPNVKMKMRKALQKVRRSGRTKYGKRVLKTFKR